MYIYACVGLALPKDSMYWSALAKHTYHMRTVYRRWTFWTILIDVHTVHMHIYICISMLFYVKWIHIFSPHFAFESEALKYKHKQPSTAEALLKKGLGWKEMESALNPKPETLKLVCRGRSCASGLGLSEVLNPMPRTPWALETDSSEAPDGTEACSVPSYAQGLRFRVSD